MTPAETETLVAQIRGAYQKALAAQAARDAFAALHQEKRTATTLAWEEVYRLQTLLAAATPEQGDPA